MSTFDTVGFLGFDVFGTVVDWRSGVARAAAPFLQRHDVSADPLDFADQWRALYQPSMQRVRSGERPYVTLDVLNRENLETVLARYDFDFGAATDVELVELNRAWDQLDPWPDAVAGLTRLKRKFAIGALSNGHIAGMLKLAKFGGLPWDVILGAEIAGTYKPQSQVYVKSVKTAGFSPESAGMIAAHNSDLAAARANGLKTVFVRRSTEYGPNQTLDLSPAKDWDLIVGSLTDVADALGC